MSIISILLRSFTIVFGIYFLSSCGEVDPLAKDFLPPTISLAKPVIQTSEAITLKCLIDVRGITHFSSGFEYGVDEDLTNPKKIEAELEEDYFYAEISDAMQGAKYYYRAYIKNERYIIKTEVGNFTLDQLPQVEVGDLTWAAANVAGADGYEKDNCWYYTWDQAISVCPEGWRLPTVFELNDLLNSGTTWKGSGTHTTPRNKAGRWLGPNHSRATASNPGAAVFFPASGYRNHNSGNLNLVDEYGSYWSSNLISDNSWYLSFTRNNIRTEYNGKTFGRLVRCVEGLIYPPELTTNDVTEIENVAATLEGEITSDGGVEIIERGFVYSTTNNPPSLDGHANTVKVISDLGEGVGKFTKKITGLIAAETYYVCAYAANASGTSYGYVEEFTTSDPPDYVDGLYSGVGIKLNIPGIEDLWWAPVNLGYTTSNKNGDYYQWGARNPGDAYSTATTWPTENNPCPTGWRVPLRAELNDLSKFSSNRKYATGPYGNDRKGYWFGPDAHSASVNDVEGCIWLPFASFLNDSSLAHGYYWSSDQNSEHNALYLYLNANSTHMSNYGRFNGYSLRCVQ